MFRQKIFLNTVQLRQNMSYRMDGSTDLQLAILANYTLQKCLVLGSRRRRYVLGNGRSGRRGVKDKDG